MQKSRITFWISTDRVLDQARQTLFVERINLGNTNGGGVEI